MGKSFAFLIVLLSAPSFCAEVSYVSESHKHIIVTQDKEAWGIDDHVCITRDLRDIACGTIISATPENAEVEISFQREDILKDSLNNETGLYIQLSFVTPYPEVGDRVRTKNRNPKEKIRELASELKTTKAFGGENLEGKPSQVFIPTKPFVPSSNLTVGMNYVFPTLEYQQTLSLHSGVGIMPLFLNYPVSEGYLRGMGGFLQYHYYTDEILRGYWAKVGLGFYNLNAGFQGAEDTLIAPAVAASFGRRMFWNSKLNFGFAVGGQYVLASSSTGLPFSGFIPSIILDVGLAF